MKFHNYCLIQNSLVRNHLLLRKKLLQRLFSRKSNRKWKNKFSIKTKKTQLACCGYNLTVLSDCCRDYRDDLVYILDDLLL